MNVLIVGHIWGLGHETVVGISESSVEYYNAFFAESEMQHVPTATWCRALAKGCVMRCTEIHTVVLILQHCPVSEALMTIMITNQDPRGDAAFVNATIAI